MSSNGQKGIQQNLLDRFRFLAGFKDSQKGENSSPPKARFSIWYFVMAVLLLAYLQQWF
jgi:hypothetical protein